MKTLSEDVCEIRDKVACMAMSGEDPFLIEQMWEVLFLEPAERMWEWVNERNLDIGLTGNSIEFLKDKRVFYVETVEEDEGG